MSDIITNDSAPVFDVASIEVDPAKEKNGVIFTYGGVDFVIAHHMTPGYRTRYADLQTENSHALRLDNEDSRRLKDHLQNVAISEHLIKKWGPAVRGQGAVLAWNGQRLIWEGDAKGNTTPEVRAELIKWLDEPKLRILREQLIMNAMDDGKFGVVASEADAGN